MDTTRTSAPRALSLALLALAMLAVPLLAGTTPRCTPVPVEPAHDPSCDDGTEPLCDMIPPVCEEWEILAYQDNCYVCVNEETCVPWGTPECRTDADCERGEVCDSCGTSSCPFCDDCVAACVPGGTTLPDCRDFDYFQCGVEFICERGIVFGRWHEHVFDAAGNEDIVEYACETPCADGACEMDYYPEWPETGDEVVDAMCGGGEPPHDPSCDDGTEPMCRMIPPVCQAHEILAYQGNCYVCVNPDTCVPWGTPECRSDDDCERGEVCDPCGSSSCPFCEDCVAACRPGGTGAPDCRDFDYFQCGVDFGCERGVVHGSWHEHVFDDAGVETIVEYRCETACESGTCAMDYYPEWPESGDEVVDALCGGEPAHDPQCDDGTEPMCNTIPPVCGAFEILAYQDHCYRCVNPDTCLPWGEAECRSDEECARDEICNSCGSSSCPMCLDCVPACTPRG